MILSWDCSVEQTRAKMRSEESEYRESTWTRPSRYYFSTRLFSIYDDKKKKKKKGKKKEKRKKHFYVNIALSENRPGVIDLALESQPRPSEKIQFETRKILNLIARPFTLRLWSFYLFFFFLFFSYPWWIINWQLINLKGNRSRPLILILETTPRRHGSSRPLFLFSNFYVFNR